MTYTNRGGGSVSRPRRRKGEDGDNHRTTALFACIVSFFSALEIQCVAVVRDKRPK